METLKAPILMIIGFRKRLIKFRLRPEKSITISMVEHSHYNNQKKIVIQSDTHLLIILKGKHFVSESWPD
jgi:hypothetical protein